MLNVTRFIFKNVRCHQLKFFYRPISIDSEGILNYAEKCLATKDSSLDYAKLTEIQRSYSELRTCYEDRAELRALVDDQSVDVEMKEMARGDLAQLEHEATQLSARLASLLLPEERYDKENALLEVPS
jgi:peptide chain release factor 1